MSNELFDVYAIFGVVSAVGIVVMWRWLNAFQKRRMDQRKIDSIEFKDPLWKDDSVIHLTEEVKTVLYTIDIENTAIFQVEQEPLAKVGIGEKLAVRLKNYAIRVTPEKHPKDRTILTEKASELLQRWKEALSSYSWYAEDSKETDKGGYFLLSREEGHVIKFEAHKVREEKKDSVLPTDCSSWMPINSDVSGNDVPNHHSCNVDCERERLPHGGEILNVKSELSDEEMEEFRKEMRNKRFNPWMSDFKDGPVEVSGQKKDFFSGFSLANDSGYENPQPNLIEVVAETEKLLELKIKDTNERIDNLKLLVDHNHDNNSKTKIQINEHIENSNKNWKHLKKWQEVVKKCNNRKAKNILDIQKRINEIDKELEAIDADTTHEEIPTIKSKEESDVKFSHGMTIGYTYLNANDENYQIKIRCGRMEYSIQIKKGCSVTETALSAIELLNNLWQDITDQKYGKIEYSNAVGTTKGLSLIDSIPSVQFVCSSSLDAKKKDEKPEKEEKEEESFPTKEYVDKLSKQIPMRREKYNGKYKDVEGKVKSTVEMANKAWNGVDWGSEGNAEEYMKMALTLTNRYVAHLPEDNLLKKEIDEAVRIHKENQEREELKQRELVAKNTSQQFKIAIPAESLDYYDKTKQFIGDYIWKVWASNNLDRDVFPFSYNATPERDNAIISWTTLLTSEALKEPKGEDAERRDDLFIIEIVFSLTSGGFVNIHGVYRHYKKDVDEKIDDEMEAVEKMLEEKQKDKTYILDWNFLRSNDGGLIDFVKSNVHDSIVGFSFHLNSDLAYSIRIFVSDLDKDTYQEQLKFLEKLRSAVVGYCKSGFEGDFLSYTPYPEVIERVESVKLRKREKESIESVEKWIYLFRNKASSTGLPVEKPYGYRFFTDQSIIDVGFNVSSFQSEDEKTFSKVGDYLQCMIDRWFLGRHKGSNLQELHDWLGEGCKLNNYGFVNRTAIRKKTGDDGAFSSE